MTASEATNTTTAPATEEASPNAMAQAFLEEAIAERDRLSSQSTEIFCVEESSKRPRLEQDHDAKGRLKQVWEGSEREEALDATMTLVHSQIESLIRSGLEAYHGWESANRDLSQAKEEGEAKDRELRRLRASEEQSRATITVSTM